MVFCHCPPDLPGTPLLAGQNPSYAPGVQDLTTIDTNPEVTSILRLHEEISASLWNLVGVGEVFFATSNGSNSRAHPKLIGNIPSSDAVFVQGH